ncbi:MAG: PEGA domain-containing protein [candidate division Zixibacteria bacterium]|nr:PEGA domain-containing protein [candidate division Zixibacteria bacterium]
MTLKRILAAGFFCFILHVSAAAQPEAVKGLVVKSNPEGAQITLTGDVMISGITPATFEHTLVGDYKLELRKYGYERYRTHVTLDPAKMTEVSVRLSPKTRYKAAGRSLVIPGWGQRYTDQKTKGLLLTVFAVGSVAAYLIADDDFDDKRAVLNDWQRQYDRAYRSGIYDDMVRLYDELDAAQGEAYDAENIRRITIGAVAAVWCLNLLDALFFFPEERTTFSVKGLAVGSSAGTDEVGLSISMGF